MQVGIRGGYSKITPKIGLKTNCYIGGVLEGIFEAFLTKDADETPEVNSNQPHLVTIFLPLLPDIPFEKQARNGKNITNCSKS